MNSIMQQYGSVVIGVVMLVVGLGLGYGIGKSGVVSDVAPVDNEHAMHEMSREDGAMSMMMEDMVSALRGKAGEAMDRVFLEEMIVHHEGAVAMAEMLLEGTTRDELVALGNAIISAQTGEIAQMRQWQREWFGE